MKSDKGKLGTNQKKEALTVSGLTPLKSPAQQLYSLRQRQFWESFLQHPKGVGKEQDSLRRLQVQVGGLSAGTLGWAPPLSIWLTLVKFGRLSELVLAPLSHGDNGIYH